MEEKKGGLTPAQIRKILETASRLEPKDFVLLSDDLDSVTGGLQESEPVLICSNNCAGT